MIADVLDFKTRAAHASRKPARATTSINHRERTPMGNRQKQSTAAAEVVELRPDAATDPAAYAARVKQQNRDRQAKKRAGESKPAHRAAIDGPSPIGRSIVASGLMTLGWFAARANYTMLVDTFHGMGSKYPEARAMGVVVPEFVLGWAVLEALGWSNWWHLRQRLTPVQARWFAGVAGVAFVAVVGWEVSLAWDRSVFAAADIAFKWAMTHDPGDHTDKAPVQKDADARDVIQQALAGFVLPMASLLATLGAEMLDHAMRGMRKPRQAAPKRPHEPPTVPPRRSGKRKR